MSKTMTMYLQVLFFIFGKNKFAFYVFEEMDGYDNSAVRLAHSGSGLVIIWHAQLDSHMA